MTTRRKFLGAAAAAPAAALASQRQAPPSLLRLSLSTSVSSCATAALARSRALESTPMTMYFPLVVHGAMLIEPTENESVQTLDEFVDAMKKISDEATAEPDFVKAAPQVTRLRRLDETRAARKPVLRWTAPETRPEPSSASGETAETRP